MFYCLIYNYFLINLLPNRSFSIFLVLYILFRDDMTSSAPAVSSGGMEASLSEYSLIILSIIFIFYMITARGTNITSWVASDVRESR